MTPKAVFGIFGGVIALVVLLALAFSTFAIVDPGTRGVHILFGDADDQALDEGLHWKNPFASVELVNVRQVVYDQKAEAASADLQTVHTQIAVNYKPDPSKVAQLYKVVGPDNHDWETVLLRPAIQEVSKAITARFTAEELIQRRDEAKQAITEAIMKRLAREHVIVTEVSVTDFGFNKAFNDAIEAKQIAEQRAKQEQNELNRVEIEAQQMVKKAEANKTAQILDAEAKAKEIEILAQAEADFQQRVGKAATPAGVKLRALEKWNGQMPRVVSDEKVLVNLGLAQ
jgi:regulator of protease activity HflC (stomatin/prohibitin superfamily)